MENPPLVTEAVFIFVAKRVWTTAIDVTMAITSVNPQGMAHKRAYQTFVHAPTEIPPLPVAVVAHVAK